MTMAKRQADTSKPGAEKKEPEERKNVRATVTRGDDCRCTIQIEADADYLQEQYEERLSELQAQISLPGFRRGKAPRVLVERKVSGSVKSELLQSVLSEAYEEAVRENGLHVVAELETPDVENLQWEPGQPGQFQFVCEVLPEIELDSKNYKGIEVEVPALEVTSDMMQKEMERFAAQFSTLEKVEEGTIDSEDRVHCVVSLAGDGEQERWSKEVDFRPVEERIGPFEVEGLKGSALGAKPGDVLKLEGKCTDEGAAREGLEELAGRQVPIQVKIEAIYRRKTPEINDEFAEKLNFSSADEIRTLLRQNLEREVEARKKRITDLMILFKIMDSVKVTLPPSLLEKATEDEKRSMAVRALRNGASLEQAEALVRQSKDIPREIAEHNLKKELFLKAIADQERIYVTEAEVAAQVKALAASRGWTERQTMKFLEKENLLGTMRAEMRERKTRQFLLENAKVNEIPPEEFDKRYGERLTLGKRHSTIEVVS